MLSFGLLGRVQAGQHFEFGAGGQLDWGPEVPGSRLAPHDTPGLDYEDWLRGEVIENYDLENPGQLADFPNPEPTSTLSGRAVGYLGFGGFGPLRWNGTHANFIHVGPELRSTESYQGQEYTLYTESLTDDRFVFTLGNEAQFELVPGKLDLVWGLLYGNHWDDDNDIAPTDHERWYVSTVLRLQAYLSPVFHILLEGSAAKEVSKLGNVWRNHGDSVFQSADGLSDARGLEFGDASERDTVQVKGGVVLNPLGPGVYTRPSIRLLYGAQYSSQNQAWGNSFVESLSQFNEFGAWESHWHHVLALEAEAWF